MHVASSGGLIAEPRPKNAVPDKAMEARVAVENFMLLFLWFDFLMNRDL